jgi:hypothetical protein
MRQVSVSDVAAGVQADLQLDGAGAEVPLGQRESAGETGGVTGVPSYNGIMIMGYRCRSMGYNGLIWIDIGF